MNVKTLISTVVLSTALFASNAYAVNVSDAWARASAGLFERTRFGRGRTSW